jgi:GrpB-like predicted nucleotidyltransferase (UPF0157 family)
MAHVIPVEIVPYDAAWPTRFEAERAVLLDVFRTVQVQIEHVGSTAVAGLGAKPVIDIMLGVDHLSAVELRIPDLVARGYEYISRYEPEFPERRLLSKPQWRPRAFHLHAVERSTPFWHRLLVFRDFLRWHGEVAVEYCELKKRLAAVFGHDRDGYARAKTAFIDAAVDRANRELRSPCHAVEAAGGHERRRRSWSPATRRGVERW